MCDFSNVSATVSKYLPYRHHREHLLDAKFEIDLAAMIGKPHAIAFTLPDGKQAKRWDVVAAARVAVFLNRRQNPMSSNPYQPPVKMRHYLSINSYFANISIGIKHTLMENDFLQKTSEALSSINKTKIGKRLLDKIATTKSIKPVPGDSNNHSIIIISVKSLQLPGIQTSMGAPGEDIPKSWAICIWDHEDAWIQKYIDMKYAVEEHIAFKESRPSFVDLFHELVHCYRYIKGTSKSGIREEEKTIGYAKNLESWLDIHKRSLQKHHDPLRIRVNENALRFELGLPLRLSHEMGLTKHPRVADNLFGYK